ncbi:MAG: hypothetical protein ACRDMJ_16565 [Solirubrobacteraceae bacterium]
MRARSAFSLGALVAGVVFAVLGLLTSDAAGTCAAPQRCAALLLPAPLTISAQRIRGGRADVTVSYRVARDGRVRRVADAHSAYPRAAAFFPGTGTWYEIRDLHLVVGRGARVDAGRVVRVIGARRPSAYDLDLATGSLYFVSRGVLFGAHGARSWRLGSLRGFGMSADTWMVPLGGLVQLMDNDRLAVVRPDGSLFASTRLPRDHGQPDTPSSQLQIAPDRSAVAFTVAFGRSQNPYATRRVRGSEVVYLLRPGAHAAVPLFVAAVRFAVCERGAWLQWHASWLLYGNTEGNLAAIDTTGAHRPIDLDTILRGRLGETPEGFDARWGT